MWAPNTMGSYSWSPWRSIGHTRIPKILDPFEGYQGISGGPEPVPLPCLHPNDQKLVTWSLQCHREVGFLHAEEWVAVHNHPGPFTPSWKPPLLSKAFPCSRKSDRKPLFFYTCLQCEPCHLPYSNVVLIVLYSPPANEDRWQANLTTLTTVISSCF